MCLLFFNINDSCNHDSFRLVLVNNRDEYWKRPTKIAEFWNNNSCISGLDDEPGRQGGTWLGANRQGRLACLVNISSQQDTSKKGRGFLVTDFLTTTESKESYAKEIASNKEDYNGFILTLIELGAPHSSVTRVTNDKQAEDSLLQSTPSSQDYYSVGNSPVNLHWRKMEGGQKQFEKIVKAHPTVSSKAQLKEELFDLMADRTRYLPDPQLEEQAVQSGWDRQFTDAISAISVWSPERQYGTRTTTVVLIDWEGNCDYTEKTLHTPVNQDKPQWSTTHFNFTVQVSEPQL